MQLFDLFKPPTHQRPPPSGENGAALGLLEGQLGGGQYLLGGGQLLGLTRQLRARWPNGDPETFCARPSAPFIYVRTSETPLPMLYKTKHEPK